MREAAGSRQQQRRRARRQRMALRHRLVIHGFVIAAIGTALAIDGAHLADWLFLTLSVLCEFQ